MPRTARASRPPPPSAAPSAAPSDPAPPAVVPTISFVILGAPRTKKNHGKVIVLTVKGKQRKFHVQSDAHRAWETRARWQLNQVVAQHRAVLPYRGPVNVRARFYRDALVGDLVGYAQALADVLQRAGIVRDDKLVEGWDGSRLDKDAANPRITVTIGPLAQVPQEDPPA